MDLPNLPLSRFERWCLVLFKKPVLWALMLCTGGATLVSLQGIAQTQSSAQDRAARSAVPGSVAVKSVQLEKQSDDRDR